MNAAIEAILFDIDDTICTYRREATEILPLAFDAVGVEPFFDEAAYVQRYDDFTEESEDVRHLRELCFAEIARERGKDPALGRELARAYAAERDHRNVHFLPGAREMLETLSRKYRVAAVTNGDPEMQSAKLDSLGVDCFETVIHAGYDTLAKPDPEPFHVALDAVDTHVSQALFVGNSLDADIAGAAAAGLRSVWVSDGVTTDPTPTPDHIIETPGALLELLSE
jgi:putative hydrolase of the HAD superfamily